MANFCSQCGNPLQEGDLFCSKCGRPLTSTAGQTEEKQVHQSSATQGAWGVNSNAAGSAASSSAAGNTSSASSWSTTIAWSPHSRISRKTIFSSQSEN